MGSPPLNNVPLSARLHVSVCLCLSLSVCVSLCPSLSVSPFLSLSACLCPSLSDVRVCLSVCLPACLSVCLSVALLVYLSVRPPVFPIIESFDNDCYSCYRYKYSCEGRCKVPEMRTICPVPTWWRGQEVESYGRAV